MWDFWKFSKMLQTLAQPPVIALTPSLIIYEENKVKVHYYPADAPATVDIPVLIINSMINKYYILDLTPGKSYVEYLVNQGFKVYMLDWGVPDAADKTRPLATYITQYLHHAIEAVQRHAASAPISLIGYCMGGTLALMYSALYPQFIKNLLLLATPIDFHNQSLLSIWSRKEHFDVDRWVNTYGNIPAEVLQSAFLMLKPTKNITKYVDLMENIDNEEFVRTFLAFDYWVNDAVAVPGEAFRQFIRATYQDNLLMNNAMYLDEQLIDLQQVRSALLNIVATHDDIVPPSASMVLMDLVGSDDKEELVVKGGHHGLSIGPSALQIVWPKSAQWLKNRSSASTPQQPKSARQQKTVLENDARKKRNNPGKKKN
jgi:polyhydroxyalkanoate synthase subunit PhaC